MDFHPCVTFRDRTESGDPFILPNPKLIALHAAICDVLHTSGAGEVIDKILASLGDDDAMRRGLDLFELIRHVRLRGELQEVMSQFRNVGL